MQTLSSANLFPAGRRVLFVPILIILTAHAFAYEPVDIGEIEVTEKPVAEEAPQLDSTAAATVIKPEGSKDLNTTVPELLEQSAGVHVRRYGGLDDFSAISLRGSTAAQVQIYLDDIPLTTPDGQIFDFSIIPLEMIDRIEVYRGGSPGMLPDSTASGAVILLTKERPEKFTATIRNTAGSFFTYRGLVSAASNFKKFSGLAAYERSQSEGNFLFNDNNGTTFNPADDRMVERRNNNFASNSLYSKFIFGPSEGLRLSVANVFFNKEQGIPGLGNMQSSNAKLETWRDLVSVTVDKKLMSVKGLGLHADAFFDFLNSQFSDPNGEIGLGIQRNDDDTYRFGENIRLGYTLGKFQSLEGFVSHRSEFFLPTNRAATPSKGQRSTRHSVSLGVEDEISVFGDRLTIVPSLRLVNLFNHLTGDDPSLATAAPSTNSRGDHQISAKAGVGLRIVGDLWLKGNFYRGFRNPTFSELFGDRGTIVGNPQLSPERAINFDVGLAYRRKEQSPIGVDIGATYFRHRITDLIQFLQTSQFTVRAQNLTKALIQGMEVSAKASWKERLGTYTSYTFQHAKDAGSLPATSGKYLPGRPRHELASGIIWTEPWSKWFSTRLSAELNYLSGNYLDTQNLLSLEDRMLLSLALATIFLKGITLSFSVKNLLDDRISDLVGYPLPGRSYWGTVELKI